MPQGRISSMAPHRTETPPNTFLRHLHSLSSCLMLASSNLTPFLTLRTIEGEEGGVVNAVMYENSCRSNDSDAEVFVSVPGDSVRGIRRVTEATDVVFSAAVLIASFALSQRRCLICNLLRLLLPVPLSDIRRPCDLDVFLGLWGTYCGWQT